LASFAIIFFDAAKIMANDEAVNRMGQKIEECINMSNSCFEKCPDQSGGGAKTV
jgi:hypothetical protein